MAPPDPFGNISFQTGPESASNPFRFSSKYADEETGLVYYGYRYMHPEQGRWLARDPIEERGGLNLCGFILNNGLGYVDYLGLDAPAPTSMSFEALLEEDEKQTRDAQRLLNGFISEYCGMDKARQLGKELQGPLGIAMIREANHGDALAYLRRLFSTGKSTLTIAHYLYLRTEGVPVQYYGRPITTPGSQVPLYGARIGAGLTVVGVVLNVQGVYSSASRGDLSGVRQGQVNAGATVGVLLIAQFGIRAGAAFLGASAAPIVAIGGLSVYGHERYVAYEIEKTNRTLCSRLCDEYIAVYGKRVRRQRALREEIYRLAVP